MSAPEPFRILVTGGGGYVAQFVLKLLHEERSKRQLELFTTVKTTPWQVPLEVCPVVAMEVDFQDPDSVRSCLEKCSPHIVVHCAALSSPAFCEKNSQIAFDVNCPTCMLDVLEEQATEGHRCNILYLSTDQVYGTGEPPYTESGPTDPLNEYSKSKLAFEEVLLDRWPASHCAVLRCSNIYGPMAPLQPIKGNKFLQWLDSELRQEKELQLFEDEFRSFVSVEYVAKACSYFVFEYFKNSSSPGSSSSEKSARVFNCGGPDALNRVQVAQKLLTAFDIPEKFTNEAGETVSKVIPTPRALANMPYDSGLNISMNSDKLASLIGPDTPMLENLQGIVN